LDARRNVVDCAVVQNMNYHAQPYANAFHLVVVTLKTIVWWTSWRSRTMKIMTIELFENMVYH
jgi:hypothetical protein